MKKLINATKIKSPLSWYGGKTGTANWLLSFFPPCSKYVEVFGGSAAALFARYPAGIEVYNDLDPGLVNFIRVLKNRDQAEELCRLLRLTPNSREEHDRCIDEYPANDPVERARQFFVLIRQSYSAIFKASWAYSIQSRGSSFHSAIDLLIPASHRLARVRIENEPFWELIEAEAGPDTLFYLDPPYLPDSRCANNVYQHEMTHDQHVKLLDMIVGIDAMVALSGYPSELYTTKLQGWHLETKQVCCLSSATTALSGRVCKPERTECLWINPAALDRLCQRGRIAA